MPFGQHQDTELWNNQFAETKILGLPVSRQMCARGLVYMESRDKDDVATFHKGIQYALEKLGKSNFGFLSTTVSNSKSKRHEGSGNELVYYSRTPCLGADQKARGLWERDCQNNVLLTPSVLKIRARRFVLCLYSHNYFEQEIKNALFSPQFTYVSRSYVFVRT